MFKVILAKVSSNHNNLRTDTVEGETVKLPEEGDRSFVLIGKGLEFGARLVQTTPIKSVLKVSDAHFEFKTLNSHYKLEVVK